MDDYGYIYIMTNKSFEGHDWVKIGYSNNPEKRRKQFNKTNLPFDYEIYATYKVKKATKNKDLVLHELIQTFNPDLRINEKREFFEISPEQAYHLLYLIAQITNTEDFLELKANVIKTPIVKENNISYDRQAVATAIINYLDKRDNLIVLTRGNVYQRFTTPVLREKVGLIGDGSWSAIKDLIAYQIKSDRQGILLTLYIGPGKEGDRKYWLDFAVEQGKPFKVKGTNISTTKWKRIYNYRLCKFSECKSKDETITKTIKKLDRFFENDFVEFEEIFK